MVRLILDVGCGSTPRGDINIDLLIKDSDRLSVNKHKIPNLIIADARFLPLKSKSFQRVISYHLLEHIQEDKKVILEFERIAITSIEIRVPFWLWERVMNNVFFWMKWKEWAKRNHIHHYSKESLSKILRGNFKVRYGFIDTIYGIIHMKQHPQRIIIIPFPLPWELIGEIQL